MSIYTQLPDPFSFKVIGNWLEQFRVTSGLTEDSAKKKKQISILLYCQSLSNVTIQDSEGYDHVSRNMIFFLHAHKCSITRGTSSQANANKYGPSYTALLYKLQLYDSCHEGLVVGTWSTATCVTQLPLFWFYLYSSLIIHNRSPIYTKNQSIENTYTMQNPWYSLPFLRTLVPLEFEPGPLFKTESPWTFASSD